MASKLTNYFVFVVTKHINAQQSCYRTILHLPPAAKPRRPSADLLSKAITTICSSNTGISHNIVVTTRSLAPVINVDTRLRES
jgi:hypothetical protein